VIVALGNTTGTSKINGRRGDGPVRPYNDLLPKINDPIKDERLACVSILEMSEKA
jgi:hypothetical protein